MMKRLVMAGLLLAGLVLAVGGPCLAAWEGIFVDFSNCVAIDNSLALGGSMLPHISHFDYSNQALKYVYYDGGAWNTEVVDIGGNGLKSSLGLNSSDQAHISYLQQGSLMYARRSGGTWQIQMVIANAEAPDASTALALDLSGAPHLAYAGGLPLDGETVNSAQSGVYYVTQAGSTWSVDPVGITGSSVDLALDPTGNPVISFITAPDRGEEYGRIAVARKGSAGWIVDRFDTGSLVGGETAVAVDPGGRIHVAYRDLPNGTIRYALFDGQNWGLQVASVVGGQEEGVDLAVTALGEPHIAFASPGMVNYAYPAGAGWITEVAAPGTAPALAVDPLGRPHLAYGQAAGDRVPLPWPIQDCQVLKYSLRR